MICFSLLTTVAVLVMWVRELTWAHSLLDLRRPMHRWYADQYQSRLIPGQRQQPLLSPLVRYWNRRLHWRYHCRRAKGAAHLIVVVTLPRCHWVATIQLEGEQLRVFSNHAGMTVIELADPDCTEQVVQLVRQN